MTVAELRLFLTHAPDDTPVVIVISDDEPPRAIGSIGFPGGKFDCKEVRLGLAPPASWPGRFLCICEHEKHEGVCACGCSRYVTGSEKLL